MPKLPNGKKPAVTKKPTVVTQPGKREVLYPKLSVKICDEQAALDLDDAKKLVGWTIIEDLKDPDCYDMNGKPVRLTNAISNRPFDRGLAQMWMSEILHRRWKINGQTLSIGKTGEVPNGVHRLVGFIWACEEWQRSKDNWPEWKSQPVLDCIIVFGIDEDDATVNTIDTAKPRGLDDVMYRSALLKDKEPKVRLRQAKMAKHAINLLYHRAGADAEAFSKKTTHGDKLEFIARHPKLIDCINHIDEENEEGKISNILSPGYSAALMYLMGCSTSDPANYRKDGIDPCEDFLKWENYTKAETFWTELAQRHKKYGALQDALGLLIQDEEATGKVRMALVLKTWNCVAANKPVTTEAIELKWEQVEGGRRLIDWSTVGGIDLGEPHEEPDNEDADPVVTPQEIAQTAAVIKHENNGKKAGKKKQPAANVGDHVWVAEDGGHWQGTVEEIYDAPSGRVARIKMKNKKTSEAPVSACLTADPNAA